MAKREVQRVVYPLAEFQISSVESDLSGKWSGYANTFGFLDSNYGGINLPGCFTKSLPAFLANGFVPDTHGAADGFEYTVLGSYGYPTNAYEDNKGLFFEGAFHSDSQAQVMRTRTAERAAVGLSVGMSIGWLTVKAFRIFPKEYKTELPKYLSVDNLIAGLAEAKNWPSILIRQECALIENSLTLTPANTASLVTEINSQKMEKLGQYLDVDSSLALSQINVLINALFYGIAYDVFCDPVPSAENRAVWEGALKEFSDYNLKIYDAYIAAEAAEGEPMNDEEPMTASVFFRENFTDPKNFSTPAVLAVKQLGSFALDAMNRFIERATSLAEHRASKKALGTLSGKVVSKPNWEAVKAIRDALDESFQSHGGTMKECIGKMDDFLEKFDPNAEQQSRKKQMESIAIRSKLRAIAQTITV